MTEVAPPTPGRSRRRQAFQWLSLAAVVLIPLGVMAWLASPSPACACSPTPSPPASPIEGVVVAVDASGLTDVRGFELQSRDGSRLTLTMGSLENAAEFSPSHLAEHLASSEPVRAYFRVNAGALEVYRLEDASR
jgi:hypothetical protein